MQVLAFQENNGRKTLLLLPLLLLLPASTACRKAEALPDEPTDPRTLNSLVQGRMRMMATGIDSYFVDWNTYPVCEVEPAKGVNAEFVAANPALAKVPSFQSRSLTTPISYLSSLVGDSYATPIAIERTVVPRMPAAPSTLQIMWNDFFGNDKPYQTTVLVRPTFGYYTDDKTGWIIWSQGPDRDYDLTSENIAAVYDPNDATGGAGLRDLTYDPTNGIDSTGDIFVWHIRAVMSSN